MDDNKSSVIKTVWICLATVLSIAIIVTGMVYSSNTYQNGESEKAKACVNNHMNWVPTARDSSKYQCVAQGN